MGKEDGRATLGIDIGGTKSLYALFDERFEIVAQEKLRTHPDKGGVKAFTREMRAAVGALLKVARRKGLRVRAVGVGCAGDIDMREGVVRSAPNVAFLKDYPFRARLEKLTGAKVFVGNDVQAGLYGEFRLGAARKATHVIGIFLGTGVGGALI
ncbi:MAG TPA: ROK family protein, partial [Usitatibacter sp.]|nr:ROK family protein [Usitatibacter sp.]